MAVATITHKPELTREQVREIFARDFSGKYRIEDWMSPIGGRDFVVVRHPFIGASVKSEQGSNETKLVYTGLAPRIWARLLFTGLLSFLLWNGLTNEVRQFIDTAPEFK